MGMTSYVAKSEAIAIVRQYFNLCKVCRTTTYRVYVRDAWYQRTLRNQST